jgi:two-component system sensor histidine kinase AlgZ
LSVAAAAGGLGALASYWLDSALRLGIIGPEMSLGEYGLRVVGITLLIAAAALRYFYVAARWRNGVAAQARAQFEALQARIRPHFLFNSMNTIASLIRTRPQDAERAVEDLSDLFRAATREDDSPAMLADELDLVQRYLAIEQLRLGERLRTRLELGQSPEVEMPALLLQPLVENAILHGIAELPQGGELRIATRVEGNQLRIEIGNPRPGTARRHKGTGTALDNVRRRLHLHYGERARMEVNASEDYYSVQLRLPLT